VVSPQSLGWRQHGRADITLILLENIDKGSGSRLSATARRKSALSKGGLSRLRVRLRLTFVDVTWQSACGACFLTSSNDGIVVPLRHKGWHYFRRTRMSAEGRELPTVFAPGERLKVVSGVHFAEMPCDEP